MRVTYWAQEVVMNESHINWSSDSAKRLYDAVESLGFTNLSDFLASMPSQPYSEVAKRIGQVAPIQVIATQFREARSAGRIREAAKDCLCRNLAEKLPNGWGIGENADWQSVRALSSWSSEIQVTGECAELKPTLLAVGKALRDVQPPQGWTPITPADPIIESIFDSQWPH